MRPIPFLSSLMLCSLLVSGCTGSGSSGSWLDTMEAKSPIYTGVPEDASAGMSALRSARVCCSALDQMRFEVMEPKKTRYYEIDASSPAYQFASGRSFFQAFKIPDTLRLLIFNVFCPLPSIVNSSSFIISSFKETLNLTSLFSRE